MQKEKESTMPNSLPDVGLVTFELQDWQVEEAPELVLPGNDRLYEVTLTTQRNGASLAIKVKGDDADEHPQMEVLVEICDGVPTLRVSRQINADSNIVLRSNARGLQVEPEGNLKSFTLS
jgi:hypothetical protein